MPKEAPFDPCRQWLGIDAVDLTNARLVLGVSPEEADPLVVIRAADARLNLLRAIAPGPFELARTSLVKRVEEAREKVLAEIAAGPPRHVRPPVGGFVMPAPPSQLAATAAAAVPASASTPALPPPVPGQGGAANEHSSGVGDGFGDIAIRTAVYRKKTPVAGIALTLIALAAVAGGLGYYAFVVKGQGQPPRAVVGKHKRVLEQKGGTEVALVEREQEEQEREQRAREERERQRRAREEREREEREQRAREELERQQREREKQKQEPPENREDDEQMPEKEQAQSRQAPSPQLDDTLAQVYKAMRATEGGPDHDAVAKLLETASEQADGAADKKRVAGWRDLSTFHKGFLECRAKAMAAVKAGDEYDFKDRKIAVVEVDDKQFTYHDNGRNKKVAWDEMPAGLMLAIMMQWFDARAANDLYLGAYHFTKQEPSPKLAREHWEKAEAGAADASSLMPLLDDPVFTRAVADE